LAAGRYTLNESLKSRSVLEFIHSVFEWASRPAVLTSLFVLSGVSLVVSVVALPWYLKRLPADYFVRKNTLRVRIEPTLTHTAFVGLKNVIGGLLVLAGVAMLVLPGQGLATIIVGTLMMEFPGKRRLERRVLTIPVLFKLVNRLRIRNGAEALILPTSLVSSPLAAPAPHSEPHSVR
jgi:hypothetical protein